MSEARWQKKASVRVFSYGGGVQSTAALVLAATGRIDFPHFVFANVGEDAEHPATLAYVREVAMPYAAAHGINLEIVQRTNRDGTPRSLYQHIMSPAFKGVQIPIRLSNGSPARRHCTVDYKVKVLQRWERAHGASAANPAVVGLGISWDELQRMRTNTDTDRVIVYPLIDLRMTRHDCESVIRAGGLPIPRRSSCYFCPYHTRAQWQRMRHEEPDLFARSVAMEAHMDAKMRREGEEGITMHSRGPLLTITSENRQEMLPFEAPDPCESGYCLT